MESIERMQNTDTIELLKTTTNALIRKCEALRDDRDEAQAYQNRYCQMAAQGLWPNKEYCK